MGGFIAGSSVQYASIISPKVVPGMYKVVVKTAGQSFEQALKIEANPEKGFSKEALERLYLQGMRLYHLEENLADLTDTLDKTIKAYTLQVAKDSSLNNPLKNLISIRKEIIETNRKSIFFDEFKFRRRVSDLYLHVVFSIQPLSAGQEKGIDVLEKEFEQFKKSVYQQIAIK